jgi:hypothetical protein
MNDDIISFIDLGQLNISGKDVAGEAKRPGDVVWELAGLMLRAAIPVNNTVFMFPVTGCQAFPEKKICPYMNHCCINRRVMFYIFNPAGNPSGIDMDPAAEFGDKPWAVQFSVLGSRFLVLGSWFPVPGSRFPVLV